MMDWAASALAFALLHSLWQCALLAGAAWLTLRGLARASATLHHGIAMAFLVAMALTLGANVAIYANADAPLTGGPLSALVDPWLGPMAAPIVGAAWLSGVSFMLLRLLLGYRAIALMARHRSFELPPAWIARAERLRETMGVTADVALRLSETIVVPCVTQFLRPIIWLPASLLTRIPEEQCEALIAHELAHVVRKDALWNGLQNLIEALLFYHPAAWWLSRRIRQEREHACDDLAVRACGDALVLAESLAALERARHGGPRIALAANGGPLVKRIARLLAPAQARAWGGLPALLGALVIGFALCAGQADAGGGKPHELRVEASTTGALGVGDFLEITAHGEDGRDRFYRASVGADGRLIEIYKENGHVRPIDAEVRVWLSTAVH